MSIELAERLKREWTDRFVVVKKGIPELRRFSGLVGQVRTVNMNCRLLVEFKSPADISWYDIDPAFVKTVPAPEPNKVPEEVEVSRGKAAPAAPAAANAAASASGSPLDRIRAQNAAAAASAAVTATETQPAIVDAPQSASPLPIAETPISSEPLAPGLLTEKPSPNSAQSVISQPLTAASALVKDGNNSVSESGVGADNAVTSLFAQVRDQASDTEPQAPNPSVPASFLQVQQQSQQQVAQTNATENATNAGQNDSQQSTDNSNGSGLENPVATTFKGKALPKLNDLTVVEGIGRKIEERLQQAGIESWKALSEADRVHLKQILENAGPQFRMHCPDTWPNQAKLADTGRWQELEEFQLLLHAGRLE